MRIRGRLTRSIHASANEDLISPGRKKVRPLREAQGKVDEAEDGNRLLMGRAPAGVYSAALA
jgi:hypothetical protein